MTHAKAFAKINLGLVVGALRADSKHELVTVLQRVELHDDITFELAAELTIEGFEEDTIVREALASLASAADVEPGWRIRIDKRIPVAAGLGGGSADAAAALLLANAELPKPLESSALHRIAASAGADVPFFLRDSACLATGDGTDLEGISLPADYHVVIVVPHGEVKTATRAVYAAFEARGGGGDGFAERAASLRASLGRVESARDLAAIPPNDLASSPLAQELIAAGAFRADVSGAGPSVYGLFERVDDAARAAETISRAGRTYVTRPVGAGRSSLVAR
jgi:4-diphosphocytidyl-2-C-methyl-D-erythritol kinase